MTWDELNWSILDRLRDGFLSGSAAHGPYWGSHDDLAHYDFTYGERIGWKWDHVLGELARRGWQPPSGLTLDWGCGSGVAHRRVLHAWPELAAPGNVVRVWDHSALARSYSLDQLSHAFPDTDAAPWDTTTPASLLLISHVLNELDTPSQTALAAQIAQAQAVIWIEPGTSSVAHPLVSWRERLLPEFRVVYPCPHQATCGLLTPENERHWCHHFATPPSGIFADSDWVKFGQRAGIDLRSLPYSALVLERTDLPESAPQPSNAGRLIGRATLHKPYARLLGCDAMGVQTLTLPKRTAPQLMRRLDRPRSPRHFTWSHDQGIITQIKSTDSVEE
jgi:hypothetical protein